MASGGRVSIESPDLSIGYGSEWIGDIKSIEVSGGSPADMNISGESILGRLNIETTAAPYTGTLGGLLTYYCVTLAGMGNASAPFVTSVNAAGWTGNLWVKIKEICTAYGLDISVNSTAIQNGLAVFRFVRQYTAIEGKTLESSATLDSNQLALNQQVIWYDKTYNASSLIYPPGGWTSEVDVLSVSAGETVEVTLETESSIFSVVQPVAVTSVPQNYVANSRYTVVGDDGIVVQPDQWAAYGGKLSVTIGADSRTLILTLTGASGLVQASGSAMRTFRIAMASGTGSDNTYSTLRIVGRHITMKRNELNLGTGVAASATGQVEAPTIENEFMNGIDSAYSAATRGARRAAGRVFTHSATVTQILPGVDEFQFAPGARVIDKKSGRWYRIRNVNFTLGQGTQIDAEDDLLNGDMREVLGGMTYGGVRTKYSPNTYAQVNFRGMN